MSLGPRLALALAAGIVLAVALASIILRLMPALQYAFCGGPVKGVMCTVSALMFGYVYFGALTLPIASLLFAAAVAWLLAQPDPVSGPRPVPLTLGIVLLLAGAVFYALTFAVEAGARLAGSTTPPVNLVVAPLLAIGNFAAAWLLWNMRESGRKLALLLLLIAIFSALASAMRHPPGVLQSPVTVLVLLLRAGFFFYLLRPDLRGRLLPPRTGNL